MGNTRKSIFMSSILSPRRLLRVAVSNVAHRVQCEGKFDVVRMSPVTGRRQSPAKNSRDSNGPTERNIMVEHDSIHLIRGQAN